MSKPLNLGKAVVDFLSANPEKKYTARQVAEWVCTEFPEECRAKRDSSRVLETDEELLQQLVAEIGSQRPRLQKKHPNLKTTEGRPRKYYFSEKTDSAEVDAAENPHVPAFDITGGTRIEERYLYPMLSAYLWAEFGVYAKRIDEKRSSNKRGPNGNRWLYPDVVGMEDLGAEWHSEVRNCVSEYADKRTKLWSFEVKLLLNRSNVRECFFQAVSNSSWSNYGYLVAGEIEGTETIKELRILCAAHGIGLIKLDIENPTESQALIPAKVRTEIDWDAANRLAVENRDFLDYLKSVRQFYQTGEAKLSDWDLQDVAAI